MKAELLKKEGTKVSLKITVENDKFEAAVTKAYNKNKGKFNIPGFRKGKAPRVVIESQYGKGVFYNDAIELLFPEVYPEAIKELDIDPIDRPDLDVEEISKDNGLVMVVTVEVKPEFELGAYKGIEIAKVDNNVTEAEVEVSLQEMQNKHARLVSAEDKALEKGFTAIIDFEGFVDGVAFEGGKGENYSLVIGSNTFIPGFEDQLVGKKAGEEVEVNVEFPAEYHAENLAGKPAVFKVKVNDVKVKELPELDDEFAKEVAAVDSFAELKENLKKTLEKNNDEKAEREFEEAVITAVIENAKMDVPEVMVNKEIDAMMKDLEGRLKYQGLSLDQYMQFTGNTTEKMRDFMKENAERKVKADLVLEAVAKAEEVKATDEEINERALELGKIYGPKDPEKMAKILAKTQKPMIEKDIVIENTLKFIKENCK